MKHQDLDLHPIILTSHLNTPDFFIEIYTLFTEKFIKMLINVPFCNIKGSEKKKKLKSTPKVNGAYSRSKPMFHSSFVDVRPGVFA